MRASRDAKKASDTTKRGAHSGRYDSVSLAYADTSCLNL